MHQNLRPIAITMGDPAGIGPEIIVKSLLCDALNGQPAVVIGCAETFKRLQQQKITPEFNLNVITSVAKASYQANTINLIDVPLAAPYELKIGEVQGEAGDVAYRCIVRATELALNNEVHAIATAPLNKEALFMGGHHYPGHTELLAHLTETKDYAMVLYSSALKVIHVTTHISLRQFLDCLSTERILSVIRLAHNFMERAGHENPRIAVAGVNPHAGENGLFGDEEIKFVNPAIMEAKKLGINVIDGPQPPDTVFLQAHEGRFDIVIAMYHDQGHIPLKLLGFYDGVNVTAGLPFIRTSADHGTAFDIAWQGKASSESMEKAIHLAVKIA